MGKQPNTRGFKKILLTWWVWAIIAVVFYFIFASIPITSNESEFGWNTWEGTNALKTIFAYLIPLAWAVALVLLGISIIKKIQKSKIGGYWKVSFTIIGIVLIVVLVFFYLKQYIPSGFQQGNTQGYALKNYDRLITEQLRDIYGYEVISVGHYGNANTSIAYVNMKSLGNRKEQVSEGLWALYGYSNIAGLNISSYSVTILTPTEECDYYITSVWFKAWKKASNNETVYFKDGSVADILTIYQSIEQTMMNSERCS